MKAVDVATKLMMEVHKHTDLFSDVYDVVSIVNVAGVCTVVTNTPHNLVAGQPFFLADTNMPINITSLTRAGKVGTLVTEIDHDLTLKIAPTITIENADDAEFNGQFNVTDIPNRRTVKFVMLDSGPTTTSNGKLLSALRYNQRLNGLHRVSYRLDDNTFLFDSNNNLSMSSSFGKVKTNLRVSASASIERAVEAYTKQETDKCYLFVVLGDTRASQSRDTQNDMVSDIGRSGFYKQIITELVNVIVIGNTKDDIAARKIRDNMVDLLVAITRSIAFYKFPTNFHIQNSRPLSFVSHGTRTYNGALYVHEFIFESAVDMSFLDTVGYDEDVAMRDIDLTQFPDLDGTGFIHSLINLDTEAL